MQYTHRILSSALAGLSFAVLAGCAATPREVPAAPAPSQLYDGQPATVHAAEFPVTHFADGVGRGDAAWRRGDLDLALFMYVSALQFEPEDAATLRKIGAIHEGRGNHPLARKAFEMALTRDPEHVPTMERLALIYVQEEHNEQAQVLLTRVVAGEPERWRSYNALGVLADRRKDHNQALAHYGRALAIEPRAGIVYNNRGYSKFLAGDLVGAEQDLREAIRLGPSDRAWLNLGKVQAKARQYGMAFRSFLETLDTAHAYNEVGEAASLNGDYQVAKAYFENATNSAASYFERAHKNLAIANEELSNRASPGGS